MTAPLLEVRHLDKTFQLHVRQGQRVQALADINFVLHEGEALGLAGKSGSGKSTLMKCVYRTYLPSAGELLYRRADGSLVDLAAAGEHDVLSLRRGEITYCSQFLQVIPRVPALEVVAEPLVRRGVDRAEALTLARGALARLALPEELWDGFPSTFSGGEQQRVNIARAVVASPRLLLLDEPTASLDVETKNAVISLIGELRERGASMLVITHDDYTMKRLASRQLLLNEGKTVEAAYA